MRDIIDLVSKLIEGEVVDLRQHKTDRAINDYVGAIGDIIKGEADFFAGGKFSCFAASYIESGFDKEYEPEILLDVSFLDFRPSPEAKELLLQLKAQRFEIVRTKWAKGYQPKENPDKNRMGPFARKVIDLNTAKQIFAQREHSEFGAYQPSRSGFRTTHHNLWDDRGVGFNINVGGMDNRRGDKYGNKHRQEYHIIDDDKDMKEVSDTFAAIQRAKIKGV